MPPPGSCRRREQRDPQRSPDASLGRAGLCCRDAAPGPGHSCPHSALPFRQRAVSCRGSTVAGRLATPKERPDRPWAASWVPAAGPTLVLLLRDKLPFSPAARPCRLAGDSLASLLCSRAGRASSLPLSNPKPPRLAVPAYPLQQSRRPGGDPVRGWEWRRGLQNRTSTPCPGECSMKGQRGQGGERKGKKVSCSRRECLLGCPRSSCSPSPSASCCPGGSCQGQRRQQRGRSGLAGEPLPYLCPE